MKLYTTLIAAFALLGLSLGTQAASFQESEWKAPSRSARKKNPLPADAATIALGKVVYEAQCVSCHGTSGIGDGVAAKDLEKSPGDLTSAAAQEQSDGSLFWKITTGRAPMTAFGDTLSVEERWQVVRFVRTLVASPKIVSPELIAPEPLRESLTNVMPAYDAMAHALGKGDEKAAKAAVPQLIASVEESQRFDASELGEPLATSWRASVAAMAAAASSMSKSTSTKELRVSFGELSVALETALSKFGHSLSTPLFVYECPMASKAGTLHWIQSTEDKINPYLGSKMLSCIKVLHGISATKP